ncbi:TNT domain-containing protein, partial [Actinosynnema sp.]|uniref:TNT domain-containing protein n=1 Tax=Actinosynnema sp. TaxID=1872144 RepID=UPI003F868B81
YESGQQVKLAPGTELDRFGTPEGRVLSRSGTPYPARALPPAAATSGYRRYRVLRELPAHYTLSAEWFGQRGGGARYRATHPVADLVALGYLEELP